MAWQLPQYEEEDVATTGMRSSTATTTTTISDSGDDEPARPARSLLAYPLRLRLWLLDFAVTHEASPSEL